MNTKMSVLQTIWQKRLDTSLESSLNLKVGAINHTDAAGHLVVQTVLMEKDEVGHPIVTWRSFLEYVWYNFHFFNYNDKLPNWQPVSSN